MRRLPVKHPLPSCFLFLLMPVGIYCNGQIKTSSNGTLKLRKTQGSNQYNSVYCGLQDKEGNIWLGTSGEGVYRYDGKLFTQFTVKDGLKSNSIFCIFQDRSGSLWFGTSEGLCRYDNGAIIPVTIPESFLSAVANDDFYTARSKRNTVWSMLQDKKGIVWIGTGSGVYNYDGKKFSRFLDNANVINKGNLQLKMIDCIFEDKNGMIWFASGMPPGEEGICRFDGTNLVNFKPQNEGWFRKIIEDNNGDLLLATRIHGVLSCNLSAGKLTTASFSPFPQPGELLNNSLATILKDRAGNIWIASDYGKQVGDTLGGVWCCKRSPVTGPRTFTKITANEVSFMLEDKAGNIWLGTRNTGLYRYDGKIIANFSE
jgi:ligand-binding sensor domain-containing protein